MDDFKHDFSDEEAASSVKLAELAARIGEPYSDGFGVNHLDGDNLPRRSEVIAITEKLLEVIFPGFDGRKQYRKDAVAQDVAGLLKIFIRICSTRSAGRSVTAARMNSAGGAAAISGPTAPYSA